MPFIKQVWISANKRQQIIWLISKPQEKQAQVEELDSFIICLGDTANSAQDDTWKNDRLLPIVKFFMKGASFKFNVLMPISVPILAFLLLTVPSSLHRVKWAVTTGAKPITTTLRNAPDTACFQCQVKCQLKHVCMPSKTHG